MARKRYAAEEIIGHLLTLEIETGKGFGLAEACGKLGITKQSFGTSGSTGNFSIRCGKH
jgi:hypothetical protein